MDNKVFLSLKRNWVTDLEAVTEERYWYGVIMEQYESEELRYNKSVGISIMDDAVE